MQRVLVARALIHDPEVFILDEPAAGLDPRGRVELRELLLVLHERGKTILLSSHILSDLEELCTDLLFIDRGRVVFQGPKTDLVAQGIRRSHIQLDVVSGGDRLHGILDSWPDLSVVREDGGSVELEAPDDPQIASEVLTRLVVGGVRLSSFTRQRESLDDIYLRLTEEGAGA